MPIFRADRDVVSHEQSPVFKRFYESLPNYPHCTDKLEAGCKQAPKQVAIKRRYIQFNKPNYSHNYLGFDLDYEGLGFRSIGT